MITIELSVEFTPLPPEMEEAYWASIRWFANIIIADLQQEYNESLKLSELEEEK